MLERHPVMHHGACMVKLTRLPPSKHVLTLSTPLISNIKNKIRSINEFKYKFREVFKALKTNVNQKYFPTTFILVSPVLFAFVS
jgi:zona occludens toxin (predicted ATPase)